MNYMKQENKDRLLEMIKMRLDGCSYQEIGNKYGITKQCVQQSIANFTGKERTIRCSPLDKCIYPNIRKWMLDNNISMIKLSKICGLAETHIGAVRTKLNGEREFKISEIKAILKESGKTFEYMFSTEKNQGSC